MICTTYLYEEFISPQIQSIANVFFQIDITRKLAIFYYKIKCEEIIYLFLESLLQRDEMDRYPIHKKDIESIYNLREEFLTDISTPPQLNILASKANMSVSKLSKIFRQIFGNSIYNNYQKIRMQEAGFILRDEKLFVAEVGNRL